MTLHGNALFAFHYLSAPPFPWYSLLQYGPAQENSSRHTQAVIDRSVSLICGNGRRRKSRK